MHVIAGKAVSFDEALQPSFKVYARQVIANARAMASALDARGLSVVSGGTDNHLFLIDVGAKGISGRKTERVLDTVGISANRNTIPGDTRPPTQASGLRIGTPAMTTRGFKELECEQVADMIARVLDAPEDEAVLKAVRAEVLELAVNYPVPGTASSETLAARA
jgi:glycine hydroxymethyltransferase